MNKIKLIFGAFILGFSFIANAGPIILVEMEGTIISSQDDFGYVGLGTGTGVLDGKNINIKFTYDTSVNPQNSSNQAATSKYYRLNDPIWMSLPAVEIDGNIVNSPAPQSTFSIFDKDQRMAITPSENKITISRDLDSEVDDPISGYTFTDFGIISDLFFNDLDFAIPDYLSVDAFLGGNGRFFIDQDNRGGVINYVSAHFSIQSASFTKLTPVPEPGSVPLLALSLATIVAFRRRHVKHE